MFALVDINVINDFLCLLNSNNYKHYAATKDASLAGSVLIIFKTFTFKFKMNFFSKLFKLNYN